MESIKIIFVIKEEIIEIVNELLVISTTSVKALNISKII